MKAVLLHLAATQPLDPGVAIVEIEQPLEPWMLGGIDQLHYPYRGLLQLSLRVDAVEHADHARCCGGWRQLDLNEYSDKHLGRMVRRHLVELVDAGAERATVIISLNPDLVQP